MRAGFIRFFILLVIMPISLMATGVLFPAQAMKTLSDGDLDGTTGMAGITMYFQDLDANLLQIDDFMLDLSPSDTLDATFWIRDESYANTLNVTADSGLHSMSFCGSLDDENTPIDVDFLGFDIDVSRRGNTAAGGLAANAVTFSMVGYGSTAMFWVWDLCQFVTPSGTYDVFGLKLGEIFWAEKYVAPENEKHRFMHILLSPLSSFVDSAFIDSNEGGWQLPAGTGLTKGAIRSDSGIGGELGLKPGGGTFGFFGFEKSTGSPQQATANGVMLAGKIIDRGTVGTPYPNWKTHRVGTGGAYYYSDSIEDWNILGEAVIGVHHQRSYTRSGYNGYYANSDTHDLDAFATSVIGQSSAARPIRFEVATAEGYDCDGDLNDDTYLVTYVCGHYSRSVYYPDSRVSGMGDSPGPNYDSSGNVIPGQEGSGVPTCYYVNGNIRWGFKKDYIIGDLRIGRLQEKTADMDGNGVADSVDHSGSMVVNDISVPYAKAVIPGDRSLMQELAVASEDYLIPDRDYGSNGTANVSTNLFSGSFPFREPVGTNRAMSIATPLNTDNTWMAQDPRTINLPDRTIPTTYWNN